MKQIGMFSTEKCAKKYPKPLKWAYNGPIQPGQPRYWPEIANYVNTLGYNLIKALKTAF